MINLNCSNSHHLNSLVQQILVYAFLFVGVYSKGVSQVAPKAKNTPANAGDRKRRGFDSWVWKIPWSRKWRPTPVFLPAEFHGQRTLVGYSPWELKESDTTEHKHTQRLSSKRLLFSLKFILSSPNPLMLFLFCYHLSFGQLSTKQNWCCSLQSLLLCFSTMLLTYPPPV